jgi:hypothetical protein
MKMTFCVELGYKVGDRFLVEGSEEEVCFQNGSTVELYEDDGSKYPLFKLIEGFCEHDNCDNKAGAYESLNNVTKIRGVNLNQELLDWAVENIEVWDDEFSHLRGDQSYSSPIFYTKKTPTGTEWELASYSANWVNDNGIGCWRALENKGVTFNPPQVITKEEWQETKTNKIEGTEFADDLQELTSLGQEMGDYNPPVGYKLRIKTQYEWEKVLHHLLERGYKLGALSVDDFCPYLFVYSKDRNAGASIYKEVFYDSDLSEAEVGVYLRCIR